MLVCANCGRELTCVKNGVVVLWTESHCKRGDAWACEQCGSHIVYVSPNTRPVPASAVADTEHCIWIKNDDH